VGSDNQGRDIYGCAATGTGKTAAYMIPTMERLIHKPEGPVVSRILVLLPTRELALQVYEVTKQWTQFTMTEVGLLMGIWKQILFCSTYNLL